MKSILVAVVAFFASSAFAIDLSPEAQCTGVENGKTVTVTAYINPQKFCAHARRDMKSVIMVQDSTPFGSVYSSEAVETAETVRHVSDKAERKVELLLKPLEEAGTLNRNGVKTEMTCFFIQYQLDC